MQHKIGVHVLLSVFILCCNLFILTVSYFKEACLPHNLKMKFLKRNNMQLFHIKTLAE